MRAVAANLKADRAARPDSFDGRPHDHTRHTPTDDQRADPPRPPRRRRRTVGVLALATLTPVLAVGVVTGVAVAPASAWRLGLHLHGAGDHVHLRLHGRLPGLDRPGRHPPGHVHGRRRGRRHRRQPARWLGRRVTSTLNVTPGIGTACSSEEEAAATPTQRASRAWAAGTAAATGPGSATRTAGWRRGVRRTGLALRASNRDPGRWWGRRRRVGPSTYGNPHGIPGAGGAGGGKGDGVQGQNVSGAGVRRRRRRRRHVLRSRRQRRPSAPGTIL